MSKVVDDKPANKSLIVDKEFVLNDSQRKLMDKYEEEMKEKNRREKQLEEINKKLQKGFIYIFLVLFITIIIFRLLVR